MIIIEDCVVGMLVDPKVVINVLVDADGDFECEVLLEDGLILDKIVVSDSVKTVLDAEVTIVVETVEKVALREVVDGSLKLFEVLAVSDVVNVLESVEL